MKPYKIFSFPALAIALLSMGSCKKPVPGEPSVIDADLSLKLKDAAAFPIGVGTDYEASMEDGAYWQTIKGHFNSMTFGYVMKHGSIVQSDGSYNYSKPDALLAKCADAGIEVFGHTLCWHQNNNGVYLRGLIARPSSDTISAPNPSLMLNGSFEDGSGDNFDHWSKWNGGASLLATTTATEVNEGSRALKVTVTTGGNPWNIQMVSDDITLQANTPYRVKLYAKAQNAGGKFRLSNNGGSAQYGPDFNITTDWVAYEWVFTPNNATKKIVLDMGYNANTYFVDNITVTLADGGGPATNPPASWAEKQYRIDSALHDYITKTVTHYKGKIKAWDVLNEPLKENGTYRDDTAAVSDYFPWFYYVGGYDSLIVKSFRYAHEADPDALLFLNEYNQEINSQKLDGFVAVVEKIKKMGVPIHGVGLQMHMAITTPNAGIDRALMKLGQLGLLVRISELDIRLNPSKTKGFVATPALLAQQAAKYKYVVESYYKNIPAAQRHGITVWGVTDADSWLVTPEDVDFPLLWDKDYQKKSAFNGFLEGLQLK